jgi:acetyl-CoA acetyltransferase
MSLRERIAITGIGETSYSRNSGKSVLALQLEASLKAIDDAGLSPKEIDGIIPYSNSVVVAEDFITNLGIDDLRFSATTPLGGASCVAGIQAALFSASARRCASRDRGWHHKSARSQASDSSTASKLRCRV